MDFSTNKTDRHDIIEISLEVALNTIALTLSSIDIIDVETVAKILVDNEITSGYRHITYFLRCKI